MKAEMLLFILTLQFLPYFLIIGGQRFTGISQEE